MAHPTDNLLRAWSQPEAVSLREAGDGESGSTLYGHFAVFNTWTEINSAYEGRFLERIAPGAFAQTFAERGDSIRVLYDHGHDPSIGNKPLGSITSLREDDHGAAYEVAMFDASYVNDLKPALRAGQLGSSFRFSVTSEQWADPQRATASNPDRLPERTITGANLYEFGPVTFPAYADATAGLRSETDEFISMLRDPLFAVRFAERVGPGIVERILAELPDDVRSDTKPEKPADGSDNGTPTPTNGRLLAAALTDLRKRTRS